MVFKTQTIGRDHHDFHIYDHKSATSSFIVNCAHRTAVSLLVPRPSASKQTLIYNSRELRSPKVPPSAQRRRFYTRAPTAGGVKLNADAWDDFILNLLMCLLCTVNLKPLRVSKQSVASAALLWLGKMTSCFVNCRDGDTCILMADFWMFLHFDRRRMNNFSMLCGAARVKIRLWTLTLLRGGRRRRICAMQIICRIFIYIYIY